MPSETPRRILFASSEVYPLIKTGGLADVAGSLPDALAGLGHEVAIILPAYQAARARMPGLERLPEIALRAGGRAALLRGRLPGDERVTVLMVDHAELFDRPGNPYLDEQGRPWPDNAYRFGLFSRACVEVAMDRAGLGWSPDIVHCNDWQTALVPALLASEQDRPATVFTIHNLAYQGLFGYELLQQLGLPAQLWSVDGLEFHGQLSFMKGGLVFADRITTVSPTYAREIQTTEYGYGLEGLLRHRSDRLRGILNGIDVAEWNPRADKHLPQRYGVSSLEKKAVNKAVLQRDLALPVLEDQPLIGMVGRLVEQKGIDLVVDAMDRLLAMPLQIAVLGSGEPHFENLLREHARRHPDQLGVVIGYDEGLSHRIEGGADLFLMPSRFEPCGLNQMYSLRYGTLPIVRRTGGLADTVVDVARGKREANGFVFDAPSAEELTATVARALDVYGRGTDWRALQRNAMRRDFSWEQSAREYETLYEQALRDAGAP
jgi:starch synthase